MPIPFKTINLDKERKLRFSMGAMVEFEQLTKTKLTELEEDMSITTCANLLWVMLKQDDASLTFPKTMKLIEEHTNNITEVITLVSEAIAAAFGDPGKNAIPPTTEKKSS